MTVNREISGVRRVGGWARRMLQGAVAVAVAASVPAAWSAGGVQVNNVAAGAASLTQAGNVTTIRTTSQTTIINYQRLDVGVGETLQFVQPSAASRVLNRIQGPDPTVIDGTLWSNGRVYLVNPAGVMFGNGAVVNVAGLYAAAGHVSDADFMAGINRFTDNTGVVRNQGVLQAGDIHLVGGSVANFGQIVTTGNGIVTLTAGKDVYIGEAQSPTGQTSVLVKVSSDASATKDGTAVSNSGKIDAGAGAIYLGAGDLYAAGIYNNGTLKGAAISLQSGANTNVNEGTIDASSAAGKGGTVEMLGDQVGVFGGTVDASGAAGGGEILIGGDLHGGGGLPVSTMAVLSAGAQLRADATVAGTGGEIVVFSSESTVVEGGISAVGAGGGRGGFVETSGLGGLLITQAPLLGAGGTWLVDPNNLTITSTTTGVSTSSGGGTFTAIANSSSATLAVSLIQSSVANNDVVISASGWINWLSGANLTYHNHGTNTLTLLAGGSITIAGTIAPQDSHDHLNVNLSSTGGGAIAVSGVIDTNQMTFNSTGSAFTLGGTITTEGGDVFLNHGGGSVTINGLIDTTGGGGGSFYSTGTAFTLGPGGTITTGGADVNLNHTAAVTVNGLVTTGNGNFNSTGAAFTLGPAGTITTNNGNVDLNQTGVVTVNGVVSLTGNGSFSSAGTDFTLAGSLTTNNQNINLNHSAGVMTIGGMLSAGSGVVTMNAGSVSQSGNTPITAGTLLLTLHGNGALNATGNLFSTLSVVENASGSSVAVFNNQDLNLDNSTGGASALTVQVNGNLAVPSNNRVSADGGTLTLIATDINIDGGSGSLTAASGLINLQPLTVNETIGLGQAGGSFTIGSGIQRIGNVGTLTFGSSGQTGNVGVQQVDLSGRVIGLVNILGGTGTVTLTDGGGNPALVVPGNVFISGASILAGNNNDGIAKIKTTGGSHIGLAATGSVGTSTRMIQIDSGTINGLGAAVNVTTAGAVFLQGIGSTGNLTFELNSSAGSMNILAGGNINPAAGGGTLTATGAIILNATGGIGTTGALGLGAGTTASLTTHGSSASGNIHVLVTSGSAPTLTLLTLGGGMQTNTIDSLGDLSLSGVTTPATDALVVNAAGNLFVAGQAITGTGIALNATGSLFAGGSTLTAAGGVVALTSGTAVDVSTAIISAGSITISSNGGLLAGGASMSAAGGLISLSSGLVGSGNMNVSLATLFTGNTGTVTLSAGSGGIGGINATGSAITGRVVSLATGATGNLDATLATLNATSLTLHAGTGLGNGSITLANATLGGALAFVWFEQDASLTSVPMVGTASALTVISHQGNVTISTDQNLASLTAQGNTIFLTGNATASGAMSFNGNLIINQNTTLTGTGSGSNLTITGTFASPATGPSYSLTTNFGGLTTLGGGSNTAGTAVSTLTVNSGSITVGNGSAVSLLATGSITLTGSLSLNGPTTVASTGGGNVTFAGTIDSFSTASHSALTVSTSGLSWFQGNVGANTPLGGLTTAGGGLTDLGNGGTFTLNVGSPILFGTDVVLLANTTLTATGGDGTVTFNKTLTSASSSTFTLTINAGAAVTFMGNVGDPTVAGELGMLVVNATAGGIFLGNGVPIKVNTAGATGSQFFNGPLTLLGDTTLTARNGTAASTTGSITLGGLVSSGTAAHYALTVDTAAAITFTAGTSTASALGSIVTLDGGTASFGNGSASAITVLTTASQQYNGPVVLVGNTTFQGTSLAFNGTPVSINAATFNLTLVSDSMSFAGGNNSVTGSGHVTLSPIAASDNVLIQAATGSSPGALVLGASDLAVFGGFALTTIGRPDGTGTISVTAPTAFSTAVSLLSGPGGVIAIGSGLSSGGSLGLSAGSISITAAVVATGGFFSTSSGLFTLGAPGSITTTNTTVSISNPGGLVTIDGPIAAGSGTVTVTGLGITTSAAGTIGAGNVSLAGGAGAVTLNGAIADTGPLSISGTGITTNLGATLGGTSMTLNGGTGAVVLNDVVTATGLVTVNGASFTNNALITANGLAITPTGAVVINATLSSAGFGVTVTGTTITDAAGAPITGSSITVTGSGLLSLASPIDGTSTVTLTGAGITTTAAASITGSPVVLNGLGGGVSLLATVTAAGGFSSTGSGFFTLASTGAINTTNANVAINQGGLVTLNGPIAAGSGTVTVTGLGITTSAAGTIGAGNVSLAGGASSVTLSGAIADTGPLSITGTGITTNLGATLTASSATLNGGTGAVSIAAVVNATNGFFSTSSGLFTLTASTGINTTNANVTINHSGLVTIDSPIAAGSGTVTVMGLGITTSATGTIGAGNVSLAGGAGAVTLNGAIADTGPLSISGTGITTNLGATLGGTSMTLNGGTGAVVLNDVVTATGLVTVNGASFTNNALITANGLAITPTGAVVINATLSSAGFGVTVTGTTITDAAGAPITGSSITVTGSGLLSLASPIDGTSTVTLTGAGITTTAAASITGSPVVLNGLGGGVSLLATVTAAGGFSSTGSGFFTLASTGAINTTNANVAINQGGLVTLDGPIAAGLGSIGITGAGFINSSTGTIGGGSITLNGGAGAVVLSGNVIGSGPVSIFGTGVTVSSLATVSGLSIAINGNVGTIFLNNSLFSNGSNITLTGSVLLAGAAPITIQSFSGTTGGAGAISIIGTINASSVQSLNLSARNGTANGNVTLGGVVGGTNPLSALNVSGNAFSINSNITTNGPIDIHSTNHLFINSTGGINSVAIVTNGGAFNAAGVPIDASGAGTANLRINTSSTTGAAAPITLASVGASATLGGLTLVAIGTGGGAAVNVADVTLGGAFSSSGGTFNNTGVISAKGITLTQSGNVGIGAGLSSPGFGVSVSGAAITDAGGAPIAGSSVTLAGTGLVTLNSPVVATGPLSISGNGILTNAGATLTGLSATLNGGTGAVSIADVVNATNGFASTSSGIFDLASTGAIHTVNGPVTITHASGLATLNGPILAGTGAVNVTGLGITSGAGGTITGGAITLAGGAGSVSLTGPIIGTGPLTISGTGVFTNVGATLTASSATLNGGTGAVSIADVVNATNGFASTSSGIFNLASTGAIHTVNGPVTITHASGLATLNGPILAGTGAVNVTGLGITSGAGGTITGGAITLAGGAGSVSLTGPILGTGPLNISGTGIFTNVGATLTASSATLNGGAGAVSIADVVNATNGFSSTSSGIFDLASTGAINTANQNVTLNHGGLITLAGPINAGAGSVSLTGAGVSQTGGSITAALLTLSGTGTFVLNQPNGVTTLTGNVTGPLSFTNAGAFGVSGITTNGNALTLTANAGNITFTGTSSGSVITLTAANIIVDAAMSGTVLNAAGGLTSTAMITLAGAVNVTGSANLGAALISTGGSILVTGTVSGTGSVAAIVGNVTIGGGFSAAGGISAGATTGGFVSIAGPVTMSSGGSITAGSSIGLNGGANMTGSLFAGTSITVASATPTSIVGNLSAGGAIAFTGLGSVTLNGNATAGGDFSVVGPLDIAGTYSAANVSLPNAITLAGATTINASGTTGITMGAITGFNKDLTLKSLSALSTIQVGAIGSDGNYIGNLAFNTDGLTVLGGSIFAQSATFASAAGGDLPATPAYATIVNNGDLVIVVQNTFTMKQNEKLTVYDATTINSATATHASAALLIWSKNTGPGSMTVGDVNTEGRVILAAGTGASPGTINFRNRPPGPVAGVTNPPLDLGADLFALGLVSPTFVLPASFTAAFTMTLTPPINFAGNIFVNDTGLGATPARYAIGAQDVTNAATQWFTLPTQNAAVINTKLLFVNQFTLPTGMSFVDPLAPRRVRDLEVQGVSVIPNVAEGNIVPRDTQNITPELQQAISGALLEYLREIGIYARPLTVDELIEYLIGRGLYDDMPMVLNPDQSDYQVAVNRLPYAPVLPVVDLARALLYKQATDDKGNPITENGKPKMESQAADVAKAIGAAWQAYLDDMAAKNQPPKPPEFRAYLESHDTGDPKFALALNYLNQIRDLLQQIKNLGITPKEYEISRDKLLSKLRFENVDEKDFPLMIDGPSSRHAGNTVVSAPASAPAPPPK